MPIPALNDRGFLPEGIHDCTIDEAQARFDLEGITICDPNRAGEGADKVFQKIYDRAI